MRVRHLVLTDFRNYAQAELFPQPGANLLLGPNGAGKTNVLEALHLIATGFSNRAGRDQEMIRWGQAAFSVRAEVHRDGSPGDLMPCQVTCIAGRGKTVRRAGKTLTGRGRTAVLGGAVVFSPDDLGLVKGSPGGRRALLDLIAAKRSPGARGLLKRYELALAHRNRLLADIAGGRIRSGNGFDQLAPWTAQVAELGAELLEQRLAVCAGLSTLAAGAYASLGGKEELHMAYESTVMPPSGDVGRGELLRLLRSGLEARKHDEVVRGTTLVGPHRDDLRLRLSGAEARVFASQGQQRTIALALRLAETEFLRHEVGEEPLLLLDDVFSELDLARRAALTVEIGGLAGRQQTFLTATDRAAIPGGEFRQAAVFVVREGAISGE